MAFIGIITSKKNEENLKKSINKKIEKTNIKLDIMAINSNNIENIKNIKFDTIIMQDENAQILNKKYILQKIISKAKFLILNSDEYKNLEIIGQSDLIVITYGLNLKSTLTISSISNQNICLSLQRTIINSKGKVIDPKEIMVEKDTSDLYKIMISNILIMLYE